MEERGKGFRRQERGKGFRRKNLREERGKGFRMLLEAKLDGFGIFGRVFSKGIEKK